ncbi:DUF262 domain-containing protein [Ralstonia solanacearum]|uniref:DUF262 domain-containing protein n=3 Tax=Ralstonia pseudosolanacearum TaxID=1310165 RepID=A0A454TYK6_9RALS|nr:DUF262 domain-containing protein [Ralstonia pseudosolanacearum]NKA02336.1 hypothetical protein [Ralstonia solanacearum]MCK4131027.1 DUF262 domain-containing protein [Ralstonia pseudosolanacearum]MDK1379340.1 DUF262 domain-containing protein [Ralstonia pseudosolanacearum]QKL71209.1 DUF262 domain-containing protein [Ralstonia solanacearum]QKL76417.1 DUF262 domain-containing protein [Ralstonia solanacearum]
MSTMTQAYLLAPFAEAEDEGAEEADFDIISFKTVEEIEKSILESPFRAIYQTNNFLLPQIKDVVDEARTVNLRPEYQRRSRWSSKQKSLLIESFLLNIPVPPIFLFEGELARYEVMDGQQRLLSIREFFSNQFRLSSLSVLAPLNGRSYSELPSRTKRTLDRASLSAIVLLKESRAALRDASNSRVLELRKFVFERLNTGGKTLNAQEIRNAVYSGEFNDMIISLARDRAFTDVWGIPPFRESDVEDDFDSPERRKNSLYKTMGDCQIVLRFFALRSEQDIKGSMRSILDRCMERNLLTPIGVIRDLREVYLQRFSLAIQIFDSQPFRLGRDNTRPSESMYDAVMGAIDRLWHLRDDMLEKRAAIQAAYWEALVSPDGASQFSGRANTSGDVKARMTAMTTLFQEAMKSHG